MDPREWTPIVDEMEIRRGGLDATVQIGASHVAILRKQFGRQGEVLGLTGDALVQVRVSAPDTADDRVDPVVAANGFSP